MRELKGIPVSAGFVIGRAFVLDEDVRRVPKRPIRHEAVDAEIERLDGALERAVRDLQQLYKRAEKEMGPEAAKIFLVHVGMLNDKAIVGPIRTAIMDNTISAEYAVWSVLREWEKRFSQMQSGALATKSADVRDLSLRVLNNLMGERRSRLAAIPDNTVIVARDLTPSQTAGFDRDKVVAFATDLGGQTSHTAIVANALGLPAVVGLKNLTEVITDGTEIIVDGSRGKVILDPEPDMRHRYRAFMEQQRVNQLSLADIASEPSVTVDGVEIDILGNIEFPEEAATVLAKGGMGVGLYRTEFLYLTTDTEPDEEAHYEAYRSCVETLAGRPLTIRTVDLGADKYTQERAEMPERNPFLGLRSIRLSLASEAMFRTQLRAILRSSAHGPVNVMFPLITSVGELRHAKMLLRDAMEDLEEEGAPFGRDVKIGMMVEVPSAAVMAGVFAKEVDFFSIGTNDLVQYTLAVDRTNERVAQIFNPAHPAVIRLIREVVKAGRRHDVPVSVCGESAGDLEYAVLLIGLGLRTLSVTASTIPPLKRLIRGITVAQCERVAKKALTFDSAVQVSTYLRDRARKIVPEAFDGRSVED